MRTYFRSAMILILAASFVVGLSLTLAPGAQAGGACPPCYVPPGANGWVQYGSCTDYSDPHCPLAVRTFRNTHTGQICRGQTIAPI